MGVIKRLAESVRLEIREHRSSFLVYQILRVLVIGLMVFEIVQHNYESVFLCVLTLVLLIVPGFLQVTLKIEFPTVLEIIILLFIFAAEILGEIHGFYLRFPNWDTMLHTLSGFLTAAVGFSLVDLLNRSDKLVFQLSPLFCSIVGFCFSMTIGVLWEVFEYAMDRIFLLDMQKDTVLRQISTVTLDPAKSNIPIVLSDIKDVTVDGTPLALGGYLDIGLYDTMQDLIVNFTGACVFAVLSWFYVKNRGKGSVIEGIVPRSKVKYQERFKQDD